MTLFSTEDEATWEGKEKRKHGKCMSESDADEERGEEDRWLSKNSKNRNSTQNLWALLEPCRLPASFIL
jgi:hypothetical protein